MMTNEELMNTLKNAANSNTDNIALQYLLLLAAERIRDLSNGE